MKKKFLICSAIIICILFGVSVFTYVYGNNLLIQKYGEGFEKNNLGDYALNKDGAVFAIYDVPMFSSTTNLSVCYKNTALIIWCSPWNDDLKYGIIVNDDENEISHQIEVDEYFNAKDETEQAILSSRKVEIQHIERLIEEVWDIER